MVRRGKAMIYRDLFAVADGFARRGKPKTSAAEVFFCSSDTVVNCEMRIVYRFNKMANLMIFHIMLKRKPNCVLLC